LAPLRPRPSPSTLFRAPEGVRPRLPPRARLRGGPYHRVACNSLVRKGRLAETSRARGTWSRARRCRPRPKRRRHPGRSIVGARHAVPLRHRSTARTSQTQRSPLSADDFLPERRPPLTIKPLGRLSGRSPSRWLGMFSLGDLGTMSKGASMRS